MRYLGLCVGLGVVFVVRLAMREPDTGAVHAAPTYLGVVTFATTGNGDPFHPAVVQVNRLGQPTGRTVTSTIEEGRGRVYRLG